MGNDYSHKSTKLDRSMRLRYSIAFLATIAWPSISAFATPSRPIRPASSSRHHHEQRQDARIQDSPISDGHLSSERLDLGLNARRQVLATFASVSSAMMVFGEEAKPAFAVEKPQEFVNVGTQAPPPSGDSPFVTLENGVKIKDFRLGSGDELVKKDSRVSIQCSARLLNLNGVVFYNTKNNNPDGFGAIPLSIDLGKGQAVPGLEAGLIGMKKGQIRRIIVPQELAYNNFPDLEPKPMNSNDQRALDSVVKNSRRDGAILFDVQVERFK